MENAEVAQDEPRQFVLGVNYWPAAKAMYWWRISTRRK